MTSEYQELLSLINKEDELSAFFQKKRDYKSILLQALDQEDNNQDGIMEFPNHLPLNAWFDKDIIIAKFRETIKANIFDSLKYSWCMTIPEVRAYFSPEEKGHFLHIGLILKDHEMAYNSTLDHDWKRELPENILDVELKRLAGCSIKRLDGDHAKVEYFKWFSEEILSCFPQKEQNLFLLGSLVISVGQLREIAELISLSEINFLKELEQKENLIQANEDLKKSINYLKYKLNFDYWTDEFKNKIFEETIELPPSAVSRLIDIRKLKPFADELGIMVQYKKLDENLEQKAISSNKIKPKI